MSNDEIDDLEMPTPTKSGEKGRELESLALLAANSHDLKLSQKALDEVLALRYQRDSLLKHVGRLVVALNRITANHSGNILRGCTCSTCMLLDDHKQFMQQIGIKDNE